MKTPAADSDTGSECFTSRLNSNHDEAYSVIALVDVSEPGSTRSTNVSEDFREAAVLGKLSHLGESIQDQLAEFILNSGSVACPLSNLSLAHVPVKNHLELTDNAPIHHRPRRMAPKHSPFITKELNSLLDAGITVPSSTA